MEVFNRFFGQVSVDFPDEISRKQFSNFWSDFDKIFGQGFDHIFGQGFDQVLGEGKPLKTVYSITRPKEKL